MKIENILEAKGRSVETIAPHAPVTEAIRRLAGAQIGALVVSSDGRTVLGVIAERDVVCAVSRHGAAALEQRVADVMSTDISTTTADTPLADAMTEMTRRRQRHLPVLNAGELAGIVSVGDLVKYRLGELELEKNVMRDVLVAQRFANR